MGKCTRVATPDGTVLPQLHLLMFLYMYSYKHWATLAICLNGKDWLPFCDEMYSFVGCVLLRPFIM
jgi:hypothetical protein